mgnify:CR=1 FL=1
MIVEKGALRIWRHCWSATISLAMAFLWMISLPQWNSQGEVVVTLQASTAGKLALPFDLAEFEKSNPGIRVRVLPASKTSSKNHQPGEGFESLDLSTLPDVVDFKIGRTGDNSYASKVLEHLSDQGALESVDSLIAETGIALSDFHPAALEAVTYKGKVWAVPFTGHIQCLGYNKQVFRQLGLQPSFGSWEELFEAAVSIAKSGAAGSPVAGLYIGKRNIANRVNSLEFAERVACMVGESPLTTSNPTFFQSPHLLKVLTLLNRYEKLGAFTESQSMVEGLPESTGMFLIASKNLRSDDTFGVLPIPTRLMKDDLPASESRIPGRLFCYGLNRNAAPDRKAAAASLLKWLLAAETHLDSAKNSDLRVRYPQRQVGDVVHVPLLLPVLENPAYREFIGDNPDYAALLKMYEYSVFPRDYNHLLEQARSVAEEALNSASATGGIPYALERAHEAFTESLGQTAVKSSTFDEF